VPSNPPQCSGINYARREEHEAKELFSHCTLEYVFLQKKHFYNVIDSLVVRAQSIPDVYSSMVRFRQRNSRLLFYFGHFNSSGT
jgi:hypothetical protein